MKSILFLALSVAQLLAAGNFEAKILKHPYPYKASFTIISDLHRTPVEAFEAVHKLINTTEVITPQSKEWKILGYDQFSNDPQAPKQIRGFGFPFSDTFWFYDAQFAFFKTYDVKTGRLVRHNPPLDGKFLEWYRKGYIGSLHDFGVGPITRPMAIAAVDWMLKNLPHPVIVNLNHSKSATPSGVANPCCTLLNQVLVHTRYLVYRALGMQDKLAEPKSLPGNLLQWGFVVFALALLFLLLTVLTLFRKGENKLKWTFAFLLAALFLFGALQKKKVDFYFGDNPNSPMYNLDQLRRLGIRFFWTVNSDYWKATTHKINLPEHKLPDGRSTIFRIYTFDDGSKGLFFLRNTINGKWKTLELLSRDRLQHLCDVQGTTIIYLHWLSKWQKYFDRKGLGYLSNLRKFADDSLIWLASGPDLLQHSYAYSYLNYDAQVKGDTAVIRLNRFDDPIEGRRAVSLNEVKNVSFFCGNVKAVKLLLNGKAVPGQRVKTFKRKEGLYVTIR